MTLEEYKELVESQGDALLDHHQRLVAGRLPRQLLRRAQRQVVLAAAVQVTEREILEETGIRIAAGEPVYVFDMIERDETGTVRFHYVIVDLAAAGV